MNNIKSIWVQMIPIFPNNIYKAITPPVPEIGDVCLTWILYSIQGTNAGAPGVDLHACIDVVQDCWE